MIIVYLLYITVTLFVLGGFIRGRKSALWAIGFAQHTAGVSFYWGISINWVKIMPFIALLSLPFFGIRPKFRNYPLSMATFWLLAYGAIVSLWFWLINPEAKMLRDFLRTAGWGPGQTDYRYIVQYISFLGVWALPWAVFSLIRGKKDVEALFKGFIFGAIVSVGFGFYQSIAPSLGLPWPDFAGSHSPAQGHLGLREAIQVFKLVSGLTIHRLYGLGGEPKHTAGLLVFALSLIAAISLSQGKLPVPLWKIVFMFIGLLFTISTSGWIAAAAVAVLVLFKIRIVGKKGSHKFALHFFVLLLLVGVYFTSEAGQYLFKSRVSSRIEGIGETKPEYKDWAVIALIADEPLRAFFGHGLGGADFFLMRYRPASIPAHRSGMTPTYLVTRMLAELGVVGLFSIGLGFWAAGVKFKKVGCAAGYNFLCFGLPAVFLTSTAVFPAFLVLLAGFLGICRNPVVCRMGMSSK
jgi:hypothetical protein